VCSNPKILLQLLGVSSYPGVTVTSDYQFKMHVYLVFDNQQLPLLRTYLAIAMRILSRSMPRQAILLPLTNIHPSQFSQGSNRLKYHWCHYLRCAVLYPPHSTGTIALAQATISANRNSLAIKHQLCHCQLNTIQTSIPLLRQKSNSLRHDVFQSMAGNAAQRAPSQDPFTPYTTRLV
jgi:hypothetical protein